MTDKTKKRPVRLTNKFVAALAGEEMFWDDDPKTTGFGIRSYAGGGKSFFVDYRLNGRQRRYTIGPYPRWSAEAARERAKQLRKEIDKGFDPAGDKRARRTAPTVQDLIDRYIEDHIPKKALVGARLTDEKRMLNEIGDKLGRHVKVSDVHAGDVEAMHKRLTVSNGPVRANRILAIASKMFSLSLMPKAGETLAWRSADLGNPAKGVKKNSEQAKERFFSQRELTAISDALAKYSGNAADAIRLLMLTGARPSEVMKAQWTEFDGEELGFWTKPASNTKQRRTHKLALSPAALELVEQLRQKRKGNSIFLFPGPKPGTHIQWLTRVWNFVRREAGIKNARIYDLRHTFASVGAGGGLSLPIIGRLLGHSQSKTTQRYAHLADDPLREAAERITSVIVGKSSGDVTPLRGRRS